jgi:hypothetical protein
VAHLNENSVIIFIIINLIDYINSLSVSLLTREILSVTGNILDLVKKRRRSLLQNGRIYPTPDVQKEYKKHCKK